MVARQHVAQISAAQSGNVNPLAGMLEIVVDPRLDTYSATTWYGSSSPDVLPGIEYSYLEGGEEGPTVETQDGWRIDGTEFKCRLDWGAGIIEPKALFRNVGA